METARTAESRRRENRQNARATFAGCLRALTLAAVVIGPLAGIAAAQADGHNLKGKGAGFVLYVSLMRN